MPYIVRRTMISCYIANVVELVHYIFYLYLISSIIIIFYSSFLLLPLFSVVSWLLCFIIYFTCTYELCLHFPNKPYFSILTYDLASMCSILTDNNNDPHVKWGKSDHSGEYGSSNNCQLGTYKIMYTNN